MDQGRVIAMEDDAAILAPFLAARPALFGMAYRMLGAVADAEDVLQDVALRWSQADRSKVENPAAWLMTACTHRSIDVLRSSARARTDYVGAWLPEPLAGTTNSGPVELSFALETAFLIVLERASAKERAAFLLHDVFGLGYAEIAATLDISESAGRKLASRARAHIAVHDRRETLTADRQMVLYDAFRQAILTDDMSAFSAVLADDVRLDADGGGKAAAIDHPLQGRSAVLEFCDHARRWWRGYDWTIAKLATGYGVVLRDGPTIVAAIWFDGADGQHIDRVYIMRNPDKLQSLTAESRAERH